MTTHYYQLLTSLPYLPPLMKVSELPITPSFLDQRLGMLEPEDKKLLQQVYALMGLQSFKSDDKLIPEVMAKIDKIDDAILQKVFRDIFTFKRVVVAMRNRDQGSTAPVMFYAGHNEETGEAYETPFAKLEADLRDNWKHPVLGMQNRYPSLVPFREALSEGNVFKAKQIRISFIDQIVREAAEKAEFSRAGVMLYVMQWMLIQEWLQNDGEAALKNVIAQAEHLMHEAMARRETKETKEV